MHRRLQGDLVRHRKSFFRYYLRVIAFAVAGPTTLCIYAMAFWGLTSNLGLNSSFPWPTGPLSNWMVWFGLGSVANLGTFLEGLLPAGWPSQVREKGTPGQLARGER
jgi:hypothetical protein